MSQLRSAYTTLGVPIDAAPLEVRRAYIRLVRVWHPDRFVSDPQLQKRALEMLKSINEAYEIVRAEQRSTHGDSPHGSQKSPFSSNVSEWEPKATISPEGKISSNRMIGAQAISSLSARFLISFLTSWQNVAFILLAAVVFYNISVRYVSLYHGAAFALEMLGLPTAFALACNIPRPSNRRGLMRAYFSVVCLFGVIVMFDSLTYRSVHYEADQYSDSFAPEDPASAGGYGGGVSSGPLGEGFFIKGQHLKGGPTAPVPPQVVAPAAPMAPLAPAAPSSPIALPAR